MKANKVPVHFQTNNYSDEAYVRRLARAVATIEESEDKKHIWNADFNEVKMLLKWCFGDATDVRYKVVDADDYKDQQAFSQMNSIRWSDGNPVNCKKKLEQMEYINPYVAKFKTEIVEPYAALYERFLALKPFIEKGRKPNPNAKPAYVPPRAAMADIKAVSDMYESLLKEWYPKQFAAYKEMYQDNVKRIVGLIKSLKDFHAEPNRHFEVMNNNSNFLDQFFERKKGSDSFDLKNYKLLPKDKLSVKIEAAAKADTEDAQDDFRVKQLKKVTSIVAERGALKQCKILKITTGTGKIEGDVKFEFKDGAEFTIHNIVVSVFNARGLVFNRFPSTFHDIKYANGNFHKKLSEKQMNEEFTQEGKGKGKKKSKA